MIRLDSIKILAPTDCLVDYDNNSFKASKDIERGVIVKDSLTANNINFGFNRFVIDSKADNVVFEVSAKALKNDYSEGININTFNQLIDNLNRTNVVKLDASVIYNEGKLLRADVTDNVKFDAYKGSNFYTDMACIPLPNKYDITSYNRVKNLGLVFKGKQKSFKERQIFYDKITELVSNKNGKAFLNSIDTHKVFKDFKNTIRTEGNFNQLKTIRKYIGSNELSDVLSSNAKVNYELFKKITKQADPEVLQLFNRYEGMKLKDVVQRRGIEGIIQDAGYNWQYLELWLKNMSPNNYRRTSDRGVGIPLFKKIFNELKAKNNNVDATIIDLFLDALSNVA